MLFNKNQKQNPINHNIEPKRYGRWSMIFKSLALVPPRLKMLKHEKKLGLDLEKKVRSDGKVSNEWNTEEPLSWYDNFNDDDFVKLNEALQDKPELAKKLKHDFMLMYELDKLKNSYANTYFVGMHQYDTLADFHSTDYKLINFDTILRLKLSLIAGWHDLPKAVTDEAKYQLLLNKPYDKSEPLLQHEMLLDKFMFTPAINNVLLDDYKQISSLLNKPLTKTRSNRVVGIGQKWEKHQLAPHQKVTQSIDHKGSVRGQLDQVNNLFGKNMVESWKFFDDKEFLSEALDDSYHLRRNENFDALEDNRTAVANEIDAWTAANAKLRDRWKNNRKYLPVGDHSTPNYYNKADNLADEVKQVKLKNGELVPEDMLTLANIGNVEDITQLSKEWFLSHVPYGMKVNEYNKIVDVDYSYLQDTKNYQRKIVNKFIPTLNKKSNINIHDLQRDTPMLAPERKTKRKKPLRL